MTVAQEYVDGQANVKRFAEQIERLEGNIQDIEDSLASLKARLLAEVNETTPRRAFQIDGGRVLLVQIEPRKKKKHKIGEPSGPTQYQPMIYILEKEEGLDRASSV